MDPFCRRLDYALLSCALTCVLSINENLIVLISEIRPFCLKTSQIWCFCQRKDLHS